MFSALLDRLRRDIGIRLGLLYAAIFTLSNVALLTLVYYLVAAAFNSKDREVLEARRKEAATLYEAGGVRGLNNWVQSQPEAVKRSLFVRVVNAFDVVSYVRAPEEWVTFTEVPSRRQIGVVVRI